MPLSFDYNIKSARGETSYAYRRRKKEEKKEMAKKLISVLLSLTIIACSSISIYAAETTTTKAENKAASEQTVKEETASKETATENKTAAEKKTKTTVKKTAAKTKTTTAAQKQAKLKKGLAAYIRYINPNVGKTKSLNMAGYFISKGKKYNLDPKVLMAIAKNESTFYTNAKSPYGYKGLMQTSDALARKYGYKPSSLYKAQVSIEVGAKYLSSMKKKFKTYTKALSAYAYGEGAVKSGNYSKTIANKMLKTRTQINNYLKRNNYI